MPWFHAMVVAADGTGNTVVLVHLDNDTLRAALEDRLPSGWEVVDDRDAAAAIVVTDTEDVATVSAIRASHPLAVIVAIGERGDPPSVVAMLEAGAASYLRDPSPALLVRRLRASA